jgi:hypothetical protein
MATRPGRHRMEFQRKQFYRDLLRDARAIALANTEGSHAVLHSLELIEQQLLGRIADLGEYQDVLSELAKMILRWRWKSCSIGQATIPRLLNCSTRSDGREMMREIGGVAEAPYLRVNGRTCLATPRLSVPSRPGKVAHPGAPVGTVPFTFRSHLRV